jgi:FkbM family methyltransferase
MEQIERLTRKAGFAAHKALFAETVGRFLSDDKPVFVCVGANDGVTNDIAGSLILRRLFWRGTLVEPLTHYSDKLAHLPQFEIVNCAIGAEAGERKFYYVDPAAWDRYPTLPRSLEGVGSFSLDHVQSHLLKVMPPGMAAWWLRNKTVPVVRLASIVPKAVTLLQIDTEGSDWEVLRSLDWVVEPTIIFVEHEHLTDTDRESMVTDLLAHGYTVRDCGSDYFAVKQ